MCNCMCHSVKPVSALQSINTVSDITHSVSEKAEAKHDAVRSEKVMCPMFSHLPVLYIFSAFAYFYLPAPGRGLFLPFLFRTLTSHLFGQHRWWVNVYKIAFDHIGPPQ